MEWIQVFTIIVTLLGGIFYIHTDVREIRKDMQQQNSRIDKLYELFCEEAKQQTVRTDKLYTMFIDLLKTKNTP